MAHEDRPLSRDDLEQLLSGALFADPRLGEVMDAATAPAQSGELAGLDEALSAFRAGPDELVSTSRRGRVVLKTFASGVLVTKIVAGAVGAAAVGGVALAAGAGHLGEHASPHRVAVAQTSPASTPTVAASPSPRPTVAHPSVATKPRSTTPAPPARPSSHATPVKLAPTPTKASATVLVLCRAWKAHEKRTDVRYYKWAHTHGYSVLIHAAGGAPAITRYCDAVIKNASSGHGGVPIGGRNHGQPIAGPTSGHYDGTPVLAPTVSPRYAPAEAPSVGSR